MLSFGMNTKGIEKKFYRGGGQGEIIKGLSAFDVINYEKIELGNCLNVLLNKKELKAIKSNCLKWLCIDKQSARAYGKPELIVLNDYRVIAKDNFKGLLLEII